jgi:DNA-3-methyladenine glycosylase I
MTAAGLRAVRRCGWAEGRPLVEAYHDAVWGRPVHDDCTLFEYLVLSGAQAGLSWGTILRKQEAYRAAFDGFDPARVARYREAKVRALLANAAIVRNGQKIRSAIRNARATLHVQAEFGSLDAYLWRFVDGSPIVNRWRTLAEIPAHSRTSDALSEDLKRRGFSFVGTTICYAFMQTVGMVNDHLRDCHRCPKLSRRGRDA